MAFERVPNEVAEEICRQVESTKDLDRLSRCSRRHYGLVQPFLYATFTQTGENALPIFLRTIIEKPHLVQYVKNVKLTILGRTFYGSNRGERYRQNLSFLSKEQRAWIRHQLPDKVLGREFCDSWYAQLSGNYKYYWDPVAGVVLLLCSNSIESIAFQRWHDVATEFVVGEVMSLATKQDERRSPYFANLRRADLLSRDLQDHEGWFAVQVLLYRCLEIKPLLEVHVERLSYEATIPFQGDISGCKYLSINSIQLPFFEFREFLERFHSLERFQFQHKETHPISDSYCLVPLDLKKALFHSRHSLEALFIAGPTDGWIERPEVYGYEYKSLGSMAHFEKLGVIDVEIQMLLGYDKYDENLNRWIYTAEQCSCLANLLPTSLEHLTIRRYSVPIYKALSELFESQSFPPNLTNISVSSGIC